MAICSPGMAGKGIPRQCRAGRAHILNGYGPLPSLSSRVVDGCSVDFSSAGCPLFSAWIRLKLIETHRLEFLHQQMATVSLNFYIRDDVLGHDILILVRNVIIILVVVLVVLNWSDCEQFRV